MFISKHMEVNMDILYEKFSTLLNNEDKEACVSLIISQFNNASSPEDIVSIYTKVLAKALNNIGCNLEDKNICIWKEHIRSSIVRTILENAYPFIIKLKNNFNSYNGKTVAVICPDGEYHEIGARMISDFFTLAGFNSIYVGASTPKEEFINALDYNKIDIFALSITNYFNLVSAKKIISAIKEKEKGKVMIAVGGQAFNNNPSAVLSIGADILLHTYEDILSLEIKKKEIN